MTDKDILISDLNDISEILNNNGYGGWCATILEAVTLLKEQEAVEPFHKCIDKDFTLIEDSHFDYCPYCGKPITWAKQEGR